MPHKVCDNAEHVILNDMPTVSSEFCFSEEESEYWSKLHALRDDVNKALEFARSEKIIGKPLDAEITLYLTPEGEQNFESIKNYDLKTLFIVSNVTVVSGDGTGFKSEEFNGVTIEVKASTAPKCVRCWTHCNEVGQNSEHPELCPRCAKVVSEM